MWMKDKDGLVSTLLGPCYVQTEVKGIKIKVTEETEYPFSNSVTFNFSVDKPIAFTIKIRKPEWVKSFKLSSTYTLKDGYIIISKTWKNEESIRLDFSSEPEIKQDRNHENYFTCGPLVYALPVESREIITKKFAVDGLNDYQYEPVNLVKYRLPNTEKPVVTLKQISKPATVWNSIELETRLVNEKTGIVETVKLVPLGATLLRQETFKNQVQVSTGSVKRIENFPSAFVGARNIDIWLPANYTPTKKYSVLYMHDGQMLFDSTINWNHQEWGVDEVLGKLTSQGKIKDCIVVGIWNTTRRHQEYFPQKPFESLSQDQQDFVTKQLQTAGRTTEVFQPVSDNYLKFIVTELKPMIDKTYSVYTDRANTFIAGSSMGGLISMYAICEYPGIFGGAACMSTHWPGIFSVENNPVPDAFVKYLGQHLPDPKTHKIYFDYGDQTLDALYPPLQKKADEVIKAKGFTEKNWVTKYFPGKDHSEKSWNERFDIPMLFLLKK
jgi:enterochelin esterase-like enzyme